MKLSYYYNGTFIVIIITKILVVFNIFKPALLALVYLYTYYAF